MLVSHREQSGPGARLPDNSFLSTRPKLDKVKKLESISASLTAYCTLLLTLFISSHRPWQIDVLPGAKHSALPGLDIGRYGPQPQRHIDGIDTECRPEGQLSDPMLFRVADGA